MKKLYVLVILILVVTALDQITKIWAVNNLADGQIRQVLGSFFQVKLLYNHGGVMGSNLGGSTFYLITSLFVLGFVFYFLFSYRHLWYISLPMSIIAGGALGNIIDRIRLGKVIDFLDFDFFNVSLGSFQLDRWWTFNIADAAISVGVVWLLIYILFMHKPPRGRSSVSADSSSSASLDN